MSIEKVLKNLKSKDWKVREKAVEELDDYLYLKPKDYVPFNPDNPNWPENPWIFYHLPDYTESPDIKAEIAAQPHSSLGGLMEAENNPLVLKYQSTLDWNYDTVHILDNKSLKNFEIAINALIDILDADKHTSVIFEAGMSLCFHFMVSMAHEKIPHPFNFEHLPRLRHSVHTALGEFNDKAVDIAVKCGAKRTDGQGFFFGAPNRGVKFEVAGGDYKINVSYCPWEVEDSDDWDGHVAEILRMIVDWEEF